MSTNGTTGSANTTTPAIPAWANAPFSHNARNIIGARMADGRTMTRAAYAQGLLVNAAWARQEIQWGTSAIARVGLLANARRDISDARALRLAGAR